MADQRQQINWRSRVVKTGKILASQVCPHPNNPRRHPQIQREAVAASFDELGQIAPIVVNINNGYLVDGEERSWLALAQEGDVEIDCVWVDLTDEEHDRALLMYDPIGALATYDAERLDSLLRDVNTDSPALQSMLAELAAPYQSATDNDWQNALGGLADGDRAPFQQMTFTLHDEQVEQVKAALTLAKGQGVFTDSPNENSNGNALARICETFLTLVGEDG